MQCKIIKIGVPKALNDYNAITQFLKYPTKLQSKCQRVFPVTITLKCFRGK